MKFKKNISIMLIVVMLLVSSAGVFASASTKTVGTSNENVATGRIQINPQASSSAKSALTTAPSYVIYALFADPDDLRTIKLTVELEDCVTPITSFNGLITIKNINGNQTSSVSVSGSLFYSKHGQ